MNSEKNSHSDDAGVAFNANEWLRYTRHIQLPHVGATGQSKLKKSHALIVGAGGLGSPVSLYLSAAGVGNITIIDHDAVDITNLQRQILFNQNDIGENKARAGVKHLTALNSDITIKAIHQAFSPELAETLVHTADIVLDCTDNFATRYLINDICARLKKPWVFASIHQYSGQCSLFTKNTGCFRCLFPEPPKNAEDCNGAGVMGVLPGILGTLQANEALKYLLGLETPLEGQLLLFDALKLSMQTIRLSRAPDCIGCGISCGISDPSDTYNKKVEHDYALPSGEIKGRIYGIDVNDFAEIIEIEQTDIANRYLFIDVRSASEHMAFNLGGIHIPLAELSHRVAEINKDKIIICYCQTGTRSLNAAKRLNRLGYETKSLEGGVVEFLKQTNRPDKAK